ncbi:ROK family protein [Mollicutes bacterium LVI A0039]|nr:ROK family protein [Mollicutes bacterium LVI A0039]
MNKKYLGIDVGGTSIKYALVDEFNQLTDAESVPTPLEKQAFIEALASIINKFPDALGVGISMPGFIDSNTGYMKTAGALMNLYEKNLIELLSDAGISCPIHVENDAKCAAISEMACGNAVGVKNFVCITIGTGVGGGVVVGGELVKGNSFAAGEFGIMRQDIGSERTVSEVGAIYPSRIAYAKKHGLELEAVDGRQALTDIEIADAFYANIARMIYNLIYVLNPEKILMGGAISKDDKFLERLRQEVAESDINEHVEYEIDRCKNTNNAGLIGAVYELKKNL